MTRALLAAMLLAVTPATPQKAGHVVAELRGNEIFVQVRTLDAAAFLPLTIEGIAHDFLASTSRGHYASILEMYSDRAFVVGQSCEEIYRQWRLFYDDLAKKPLVAAEVIAVGDNVILRLRNSSGRITRRILQGHDPTQVSVGGVTFEILYLTGRRHSRFERCGHAGDIDPAVYLKTSAVLSEELCQRVTSQLAAALGVKQMYAHFRNDHWFICSVFPVRFPFTSQETPPSEAEYYALPEFTCSLDCNGAASCAGRTLRPPGRYKDSGVK